MNAATIVTIAGSLVHQKLIADGWIEWTRDSSMWEVEPGRKVDLIHVTMIPPQPAAVS